MKQPKKFLMLATAALLHVVAALLRGVASLLDWVRAPAEYPEKPAAPRNMKFSGGAESRPVLHRTCSYCGSLSKSDRCQGCGAPVMKAPEVT